MKFIYCVLLITGLSQSSFAQNTTGGNTTTVIDFSNTFFNPLYELQTKKDLEDLSSAKAATFESLGGTNRFLSADWATGGAITSENKTVRNDRYKYNFDYLTHQLYAKSGDTIITVNPAHLKSFYVAGVTNTHTFYKFPTTGINDFEELLSADTAASKLKFIKQRSVTITKSTQTNANTALAISKEDDYQDTINYYILFPDNTVVKIKLNSKSFTENLKPEYQARATELLLGAHKINEESVTKLVNDMNAN